MLAIRSARRRVIVTGLLGSTVGESLPKYGSIRMPRVLPMRRISSACKMILEDEDEGGLPQRHEDTNPTLSCYSYSVRLLISSDPYGAVVMGWRWLLQIVDPSGVK